MFLELMSYKMFKLSFKIYVLFALFMLCGCKDDVTLVEKFPVEKELKAEPAAKLDSLYSLCDVTSDGTHFYFSQKRKARFFVVTDNNFNVSGELCVSGHGHGEWTAPMMTGQFGNDGGKDCAYILERPSHTLYAQPIDGSERMKVEDFKLRDIVSVRYAFKTKDGIYIGAQDDMTCEFFVFDGRSKAVKSFPHPVVDMKNVGDMSQMLLQTRATYNHAVDRIAISYFSYPLIVIRNANGSVVTTLQVESRLPGYSHDNVGESHVYFKDIKSDDKYVYALYSSPAHDERDFVLVFAWDGTPVARYELSPAIGFAIDGAGRRIVAINDADGKVVAYKM